MNSVVTLILLLVFGVQLLAEEKKPAPTKHGVKKMARDPEDLVPKTLVEAHKQLEKQLPKEELAKIDVMQDANEMTSYHLSLGMSIRNTWGLRGDGPLAVHMKKLGFKNADSMSSAILWTFWFKRHNQDYNGWIKQQAAQIAAYEKSTEPPPNSAKDPKDGSEIDWCKTFETIVQIHVGKSKKTGRWLAYVPDKGVYEPDAEFLKIITDEEKNDVHVPSEPVDISDQKP